MSSPSSLLVRQYEIGPLNNFLYLLGDPAVREMTVVDPAWDVPFLRREAEQLGYRITQIFLTHAHPDHVNGLEELQRTHPVPAYVSAHEAPFLTARLKNLTAIEDGTQLAVGTIPVKVIHMPGHTPGCQSYLIGDRLICGDVLFVDGCGRCDLPGGDARAMYRTLDGIVKKLPDHTVIHPGHNYGPTPTDTIGNQKRTNPYLQAATENEFLHERMGI